MNVGIAVVAIAPAALDAADPDRCHTVAVEIRGVVRTRSLRAVAGVEGARIGVGAVARLAVDAAVEDVALR